MRRWCILLMPLALQFVAPIAAVAQVPAGEPAQPSIVNEACPVPADPRWTPQEAFVWGRVCIGATADFNRGSNYGGRLDAKAPEHWPQSRLLTPSFLEAILLKEPYVRAVPRHGVAIVGARFSELVDLSEAVLTRPLLLHDSVFDKGANLLRLKSEYSLDLDGSSFRMLNLNAARLLRLSLRNAVLGGEVNLAVAHVAGNIQLNGSKFTGAVDFSGMQVGGFLLMEKGTELQSLNLATTDIGKNLEISGSKVTGTLNMNELHVGGVLLLNESEFGEINLSNAHVEANLRFAGSRAHGVHLAIAQVDKNLQFDRTTVSGDTDMGGIRIGGFLLVRYETTLAKVNLLNAKVEKEIEIGNATISGELEMNRVQVGGLVTIHQSALKGLALRNAQLGQLQLVTSKVDGPFDCSGMDVGGEGSLQRSEFLAEVRCPGARIKGDAALDEASFHKDVDLTKAEIDGALQLEHTEWANDAVLELANAKLGFIDLAEAWPKHLELDGLSYRSVDHPERYMAWFARLERFAPQPYDQLASVVRSAGDDDLATGIRYAGRERERHEQTSWIGWGILLALQGFIGFGYYPLRALIWVAVFVVLGAIVLRVTGEGRRNQMPWGVSYSFDLLLPIIRLRDSHYEIDLKAPARYYFYFHKIMGYLLASFLIAGVSGLTK
jgi:urease beta subunit